MIFYISSFVKTFRKPLKPAKTAANILKDLGIRVRAPISLLKLLKKSDSNLNKVKPVSLIET